jgi:hypothetical protein
MSDRDDDEPELTADERVVLDAWEADVPPPGFADRVVSGGRTAPPAPRRRAGGLVLGFAGGALVAAAIALVLARSPSPSHAAAGARTVTARETIALGRRGTAVAEAGASLAWEVSAGGAARVEQGAGDVFYRVEPGGPFVVATAAGDVRVTGTCFRVEVQMKPSKSSLGGAAIGAALAATVVVTVYEGGVIAASGGKEQPVAAGERVVLGEPTWTQAAQPPAPDATREQLLARDAEQRATIQELAVRIAGLEKQLAAGGGKVKVKGVEIGARGRGEDDDGDGRPWFDPSPELLASWVDECRIRFDSPPIYGSYPQELQPDELAEMGIEASEGAVINETLAQIHAAWLAKLVALYIEATGDAERAESMSPSALAEEIQDKAAPGEEEAVRVRIVRERAGLEQPPADLSQASPVERYLRAYVDLGNELERMLAARLGAARARELRELHDGWGHKSEMSGCPH